MVKLGVVIRVGIHLESAAGRIGRIIGKEEGSRWLVQLERLTKDEEVVILSLEESEFTLLDNQLIEFLYPLRPYYGSLTLKNLIFDANLQEFSLRISYIAALENSGKLLPLEAYEQINLLWHQLEISKTNLGI